MKFLNKFLYALISNPIIKTSQIFYEFVSLDENAYNVKKKEYTKSVKSPLKLNEFKSLEGKVKYRFKNYFFKILKSNKKLIFNYFLRK
jgi:hypothetical protein